MTPLRYGVSAPPENPFSDENWTRAKKLERIRANIGSGKYPDRFRNDRPGIWHNQSFSAHR
jgi:hypothetical protein